jgi:hypothetical protein
VVSSGHSEEFLGIDFNDKRLSDRLIRTADCLGKSCQASIPAAADGRAEMEAIHRFVDNPKVAPQKLTARHRGATLERIGQGEVALLVQDATELDVTRPSEQVQGAGPLPPLGLHRRRRHPHQHHHHGQLRQHDPRPPPRAPQPRPGPHPRRPPLPHQLHRLLPGPAELADEE